MSGEFETLLDQFIWVEDPNELCRRIVHSPAGISGATSAAILEIKQDGSLPVCGSYGLKNQFQKLLNVSDWFGHTLLSNVIKNLETAICDVKTFFAEASDDELIGFPGNSLVLCPLIVRNDPAGILIATLANQSNDYATPPRWLREKAKSCTASLLATWLAIAVVL